MDHSTDRRNFLKLIGSSAMAAAVAVRFQPGALHSRPQPHRHDRRRRAHRHPDAGESILRPLLRHDARRPRLRRSARGEAADRPIRLASAQRRRRPAAVPARCRGSRADIPARPAARLERHARRVERRAVRPLGAEQGRDDDDVSHPAGPAVSVRARRCLHHLRQLPLLADGPDRSESLSHVDRLGRQRRRGGGPVITNAEAGYDWSTYPERLERAGISWKVYQDVGVGSTPRGSGAGPTTPYIGNYGDNSLLYFHQYQSAAPGTPLADRAKTGHEHPRTESRTGSAARHLPRRRAPRPVTEGVVDRRARSVLRASELGARTTAPGMCRR